MYFFLNWWHISLNLEWCGFYQFIILIEQGSLKLISILILHKQFYDVYRYIFLVLRCFQFFIEFIFIPSEKKEDKKVARHYSFLGIGRPKGKYMLEKHRLCSVSPKMMYGISFTRKSFLIKEKRILRTIQKL